jgi:hypothetical protein
MSRLYAYDNHHRDRATVDRSECPGWLAVKAFRSGRSGRLAPTRTGAGCVYLRDCTDRHLRVHRVAVTSATANAAAAATAIGLTLTVVVPPRGHPGHRHLGQPGTQPRPGPGCRRHRARPGVAVHRRAPGRRCLAAGCTGRFATTTAPRWPPKHCKPITSDAPRLPDPRRATASRQIPESAIA